jgi:uncharacterized protein (DUF302 family)
LKKTRGDSNERENERKNERRLQRPWKGYESMGGKHAREMHGMGEMEKGYTYTKMVGEGFDETVAKVREELKKASFGVLSEIRVDKLFKEKLNLDMEPYVILGACNPEFSSQLVEIDPNSGSFLPCNILVYVKEGKTHVSLTLPTIAMSVAGNEELIEVATKVEEILRDVVNRV